MSEDKEFVTLRTDIFQLSQDLHDQRVKDFKNHLDFQTNMRKQEMENAMIQAEAISDARFQMAYSRSMANQIATIVKLVILIAVFLTIYSIA